MPSIIAPHHVPAGAGAGTPAIDDMDIPSATSETAQYKLTATGDIYTDADGSGFTDSGDDWIAPQVGMAGFEVRATLVSGNVAGGSSSALGTWLALSADRSWRCKIANPTFPDTACELTVEIRPAGGVTVTSATITMSAHFEE